MHPLPLTIGAPCTEPEQAIEACRVVCSTPAARRVRQSQVVWIFTTILSVSGAPFVILLIPSLGAYVVFFVIAIFVFVVALPTEAR